MIYVYLLKKYFVFIFLYLFIFLSFYTIIFYIIFFTIRRYSFQMMIILPDAGIYPTLFMA